MRVIFIILESISANLPNSLQDGYLPNLLTIMNIFYRGILTSLDLVGVPAYSHYTFALRSTVMQTSYYRRPLNTKSRPVPGP